jgi:predicted transcriptional regulator
MTKYNVPEDVLRQLYLEEGLTQKEIGGRFGCDQPTISWYLKKYKIPTRGAFGGNQPVKTEDYEIDIEVLKQLYFEEKLTQDEIAERLGCSKAAIQRRMYKYNIQSRNGSEANLLKRGSHRADFDGDDCLKAYMLGFCKGDVHVWVRDKGSETIRLMTNTTKGEQRDLFVSLFEPYGHIYVNDDKKYIHLAAYVNMTFSFLLDEKDHIPEWVIADEEVFFAFFAGYCDAEANIGVYNGYAVLKLDSCDKNIIFSCHEMLAKVDFVFAAPTICALKGQTDKNGISYNKDMWRLKTLAKATLLAVFNRISPYLRHAKRIDDMHKAIENINERNSRQKGKRNEVHD